MNAAAKIWLSIFVVFTVIVATALLTKGWTHDAPPTPKLPLGWTYPYACCANFDCEQVPQSDIIEGARGYEIRKTGEIIPYSDKRRKDSPDGEFHWCAHRAGLDAGKTICLFTPPQSY